MQNFVAKGTKWCDKRTHDVDYKWVDVCVQEYFSKYRWTSMSQSFVASMDILMDNVTNDVVILCKINIHVTIFRC